VHAPDDSDSAPRFPPGAALKAFSVRVAIGLGWLGLALGLTVACAYLLLRHWVWADIDRWRPNIERALTGMFDAPVRMGELTSGFEGLRPSLRARGIQVGAGANPPLVIEQAFAVVSLSSLVRGRPSLVSLEIDRPVIQVERIDSRRFSVAGALVDLDRPGRSDELAWLFSSRVVSIRNARFDWRDRLGSEGMVIAGVDWLNTAEAGQHHMSLRAPAIGAGVQGLELALDLRIAEGADPTDWRRWQGEAYVSAMQVQFAPLAKMLRGWFLPSEAAPSRVISGSGPIKTWAKFDGGRWVEVFVKAFTEAIELSVGTSRLALRSLTVEAGTEPSGADTLQITPKRFSAVDREGFVFALDERAAQRIELDLNSFAPRSGELVWRGFDAGRFLNTVRRLPVPESWNATLVRMSASGRINSAEVRWGPQPERYSVLLDFDRLSLRRVAEPAGRMAQARAPNTWPSFSNLSGTVELSSQGGRAQLDSAGVVVRLPGVFEEPAVPLSSLKGEVSWSLAGSGGIEVRAQNLFFANADVAGEVTGRWRSTARSARGEVDLGGTIERANAARVARYLPTIVNEQVRTWVAQAIGAGAASTGSFNLRGDLAEFPFRDAAQGEFRVETRVDQLSLAHSPGWPAIERLRGALVFERAGMQIKAESAEVSGVRLGAVEARIDDFARPVLEVAGRATGETRDMVRYVERSPLRGRASELASSWRIDGQSQVDLQLSVGLSRGAPIDYRGLVSIRDNRLVVDPNLPPVEAVSGQVEFDRQGVRTLAPGQSNLLGGPGSWHLKAPLSGGVTIDAHGRAATGSVVSRVEGFWADAIRGEFDWKAALRVDARSLDAWVETDLRGVESNLPSPLAKTAAQPWPLRLDWRRELTSGTETLGLALNREIRAQFERRVSDAAALGWRGAVSVGSELSRPTQGIAIDLQVPALDADAWLKQFQQHPGGLGNGFSGAGIASLINRFSLITPSLVAGGKPFTSVVLGASSSDGTWRASVTSREVEGLIDWVPPHARATGGVVTARLAFLKIARNREREIESLLDKGPARLPALDVEAERLVLADRELGRLKLLAENASEGEQPAWRLKRLHVEHPGGALNATGTWEAGTGGVRATALDFELALREPAYILDTFGIRGAVSGGGPGQLAGTLRWQGSPLAIDYGSLSGQVEIHLVKGQFLKTDPGIAKLIGVLNLQSLPRRLSLDFRDVFVEGFAFDDIRGKASIAAGVARTDDFRMRGVQAQVNIRGEANLAQETQRLRVQVRPELNAGLASLAYAAMANPAIGLGSFIAQWALRKPLQDMFAYEYDIEGSWADPTVTERSRPRFDAMADELQRPAEAGGALNDARPGGTTPR
jgi:uncharacterized protein (TIGR02099 family)